MLLTGYSFIWWPKSSNIPEQWTEQVIDEALREPLSELISRNGHIVATHPNTDLPLMALHLVSRCRDPAFEGDLAFQDSVI